MQVISKDKSITAISGRIGNFVFRTYKNGKIFAYYQPSRSKHAKHPPIDLRSNPDAISVQLREITKPLNLEIVGKV